MKESSIESRTRDKNHAEKGAIAKNRGGLFFVCSISVEQLVAVIEGVRPPFGGIKTLWMTCWGSERIFLADGPGLLRLQDRGYRVLRLVSR
jgi:hypothetical protein